MAPNRARRIFVPTNPDLADILGRTDLNFDIFYFFFITFWTPTFWISRSPDLQIPRFPGPQISKFPDFQIPDNRAAGGTKPINEFECEMCHVPYEAVGNAMLFMDVFTA